MNFRQVSALVHIVSIELQALAENMREVIIV